jgi:hypothetical protein
MLSVMHWLPYLVARIDPATLDPELVDDWSRTCLI